MEQEAVLRKVEGDDKWLQKHFGKIQNEHPNKFVAVSKGHVIAASNNPEDVVREVEKKGINPATILVEFIPEKGLILIL